MEQFPGLRIEGEWRGQGERLDGTQDEDSEARGVNPARCRQLECPRLEKRETWGTPQLLLDQL